ERLELEVNGTADDYFYLIQAWIKCGELKRATLAFEKMESIGVPLRVRTLAAMTRAHARSGNLAVAGTMVQRMKDMNLHPSSIYDLSALLEYYIKMTPVSSSSYSTSTAPPASYPADDTGATTTQRTSSNPSQERVREIWRAIEYQLQRQDSASTTVLSNTSFSYRIYLTFLVNKVHDLDSAAELIDKMVVKNISPELERYQKTALSVLQRLMKHGYFTEVTMLLGQKNAALARVTPQNVWGNLMEACMARNENQTARWVYNDMIRYGIPPSVKCKKMFSELQQLGGTTDRADPTVAGPGHTATGNTKDETSNILNILFNRQPKPVLS
ncbi:hypothetical protein BG011_009939, partial [Mortierella polycephala]